MSRSLLVTVLALGACHPENELVPESYAEPVFDLQNPAAAAWMPAGSILADGLAQNLEQVTVNGTSAEMSGGNFSAPAELLRGINLVEATGIDQRGDTKFIRNGVIAGNFADPGVPISDAVELRLNQGGLDAALATVAGQINSADLQSTLSAANPVYQDSYGIGGWDALSLRADVTGLYFDTPTMQAHPDYGVLTLDAQIPNLWVEVTVSGTIDYFFDTWDFSEQIWIWADSADISADLTVDVVGGKLSVDLPGAVVDLVGFGYDTSLLPGDVESYILVDTIRGFLEDRLEQEIVDKVPAALEEQLSALDLSFDTELMGHEAHISGDFASASIDPNGIAIGVNMDVYIPSDGDTQYAGYLSAGTGGALASQTADIGLSLSDDFMNRLLFEAWRAGMLNLSMSTEDGTLDPVMLAALKADEGSIQIVGNLPPVVVERDGALQAQMGEMILELKTPGGEMGSYLKASLALFTTLELGAKDGELALKLADPAVTVTVLETDWGASNETTTQLLEEKLPVKSLLAVMGDIKFPLPSVGGLVVGSADVTREDNGVYTGIAIDLK